MNYTRHHDPETLGTARGLVGSGEREVAGTQLLDQTQGQEMPLELFINELLLSLHLSVCRETDLHRGVQESQGICSPENVGKGPSRS